MRKYIALAIVALIAGAFYYFMVGFSKAPAAAPGVFDIEVWRILAEETPPDMRPKAVHWVEIGSDMAPNFAIQAGRLSGKSGMSYNAFQIVGDDWNIIIDGAVDAETAAAMVQDKAEAKFDQATYDALLAAMLEADSVLMTHEHIDHIMAIARHPQPNALAPRLALNQDQIDALPLFVNGETPDAFKTLRPQLDGSVQQIAPGVIVAPAAGHTAGSQVMYISMSDGTEMLLIGDIAWGSMALASLTTRPVLTNYIVFDPKEDREAVKAQLRALHDMQAANPDLIIIPAHDRGLMKGLTVDETLRIGLAVKE